MTSSAVFAAASCLSLLACAFPQDALKAENGEAQNWCQALVEPTDEDIRRFREAERTSMTREDVQHLADVFDEIEKCRSNSTLTIDGKKFELSLGYDFSEARRGDGNLFLLFWSDISGFRVHGILYVQHRDGSAQFFETFLDALHASE